MRQGAKRREIAWRHERIRQDKAAAAEEQRRREAARLMGLVRKAPLTTKEAAVLKRLVGLWLHWRRRGYIHPTRKELATRAGCTPNGVGYVLDRLQALGWIEREPDFKGGRGVRKKMIVRLMDIREGLARLISRERYAKMRGVRRSNGLTRRATTLGRSPFLAEEKKVQNTRARFKIILPRRPIGCASNGLTKGKQGGGRCDGSPLGSLHELDHTRDRLSGVSDAPASPIMPCKGWFSRLVPALRARKAAERATGARESFFPGEAYSVSASTAGA